MLIPNIDNRPKPPTNSVGDFVKWWNVNFPLDRLYREKYSIPWGSDQHKAVTLLSIHFEYEETRVFEKLKEDISNIKKVQEYVSGDWLDTDGEDINSDDIFDKLDVSNIDENGEITLED